MKPKLMVDSARARGEIGSCISCIHPLIYARDTSALIANRAFTDCPSWPWSSNLSQLLDIEIFQGGQVFTDERAQALLRNHRLVAEN